MERLKRVDQFINNFVEKIGGILLVLLTFIVFVQVITRYVFHISIGGIGELPVYFMIITVWLFATALGRKDEHIKLELIELVIKSEKVNHYIATTLNLFTLVSLIVFTYLCIGYLQFGIKTGDTSAGLKFPLWWLTVIILFSSTLLTIYYGKHLIDKLKGVRK